MSDPVLEVDARGLACPLPLLRTRAALRRSPSAIAILVTDGAARADVTALLEDGGFAVRVREDGDGWRIEARRVDPRGG